MKITNSIISQRFGQRVVSFARALPAVLALAALVVPTQSLAQAPTFNALVQTPVTVGSGFPEDATVGDINGDGKLDVIIPGIGGLRVLLGNGNGTFVDRQMGIADVTMSNVVNLSPGLVLYVNQGPKTVGGIGGLGGGIKAVDLNHDGKLDLIGVSTVGINFVNYSFATVMLNTGTNDANGVPIFTTTHHWIPFLGIRPVIVGDLNGDTWPDFIVGTSGGNLQVWTSNGGNGTFTPGQVTNLVPSAGGPSTGPGVIVDLNGDGKADFVEAAGQAGAIDIFYGNGDGTLQTPSTLLPNNAVLTGSPTSVAVADVNGDGRPDILSGNVNGTAADGLRVYLNLGGGVFGAPTSFAVTGFSTAFNGGCSVSLGDINGDGKLDAVLTNTLSNSIAVLLGDGAGGFGTQFTFAAATYPTNGLIGDFNGDGKADIGFVLRNSRSFGVLTNTTVFAPPLPTQTLTILGGSGTPGTIAPNVEYYNPATGLWQPAYLTGSHPWGFISGTNSWINYKTNTSSDPGAGLNGTNSTYWYLYRVRFTVPADAVNPQMTFSANADNFTQVAINGVTTGGSTQFINNANVPNVIVGGGGVVVQFHADSTSAQSIHPGENTITLNVGDWGGLNGFNFRIDLTMQSSQPLQIVPTAQPPVVASSSANLTYGTPFSYQISATNTPTSYSATGLPAGLSINSTSGLISGTPTQASTSPITVNLSATNTGGTGTGTLTLNIAKASASIQLSGLTHTYDGTVKSATATTSPANLNVVFNYVGGRINAGSYGVQAVIDSPNYTGSTTGTLEIAKASSATMVTINGGPFTYTGAAQTPATVTVTGAGGLSLTLPANYTNNTNAGTATASYSYAGDANHDGSSDSKTFAIGKAPSSTVVTINGTSFTYTGAAQTPATVTVTGAGGLSLTPAASYANNTDAGTATASYTFAGDANHDGSSGSQNFTINKANATVVVLPYNVEYDGLPHSATVASITGVGGQTGATVGTVALSSTHTAVGTYADTWSFTGTANYNSIAATPITDKIVDTTAPAVTASLVNVSKGGDDESTQKFMVVFTATDLVGVKTLKATLNGVTVTNGQIVQLQTIKSGAQSVKREDDGRLQIKATSFLLTVVATDAAANTTTKTATAVFIKKGKDDDDKKGGDKDDDKKDDGKKEDSKDSKSKDK